MISSTASTTIPPAGNHQGQGTVAPSLPTDRRRRSINLVILMAIWVGVLLPLALHVVGLPFLGRLQRDDYYGVIRRMAEGEGLTTDIGRWLDVRIVQHRVVLPALLWRLNIALTGGDNRVTAALALVFLTASFVLLVKQLPRPPSLRSLAGWGPALLLSVLVFAPGQTYNIALSFGGTHYYLADFFSLLAIFVLLRPRRRTTMPWILLPIAVLGILSFSSHLAVWPALVAGALYAALPRRRLVPVLFGAGLAFLVYVAGTHLITRQARDLPDLDAFLRYLGCFVGAIFTHLPGLAYLIGWTSIVASLALHGWIACRTSPALRRRCAFWMTLQVYVLGCGVLAALGRAEMGADQALVLRYALFSSLFFAGFLISLGYLLLRALPRRRQQSARLVAMVLIVAGAWAFYERDLRIWTYYVSIGKRQLVTEEGLRLGIWDADLVRATVTRIPSTFAQVGHVLRRLGHVPFDRPARRLDARVIAPERISPTPHPDVEGAFDALYATDHRGFVRARGWIRSPQHKVSEVLFLGPDRHVVSRILLRLPRTDLRSELGWTDVWIVGWEGYVRIRRKAEWTAFYRLEGDPTLYPLPRAPGIPIKRVLALARAQSS